MVISKRQTWWISVGVPAALILLIIILFSPVYHFLASPEQLRDSVKSFGWLAPAVIIFIHALQVVVAPIPGQPIDLANGYLFGTFWGSVISMVGLALGSLAAIGLAKRFGRPVVAALITPKGMTQIRPYVHRHSEWLFFFLFLIPITPDDLLCFAIGLSGIPFWRAFLIAMIGRLPGVVATVATGALGHSFNPLNFTLYAALVSILLFVIVWKTPLGKAMNIPKNLTSGK